MLSTLEYKIRDGRGVVCVCMGGGEGKARLLGLGQDFFSKPTTVADFFLIFQYDSQLCARINYLFVPSTFEGENDSKQSDEFQARL